MEPHYGRDRRVTGMPGSHPAPRECLCSALGTSRSWGRAEWDYSSSLLLLLLLPLAGWGGPRSTGDPSRGPSLGQWCKAQRSHPNQGLPAASAWPRSRAAAGLSWVLGRLQAWVPPAQPFAPSGEVPRRRESSARVLGCQPWHQRGFFYFLLMTFLFSLGGLRSGISRNHHGMSFLRRKRSPGLLPRGWHLAPLVTPRGILSPWTRLARYSWVQTCHPAAGFWLFRLRSLLTA